ncbi:MAG TPA: PAS domain S-box protein [Aggregatilineales bacterium]|nr:PAS domain S-box protein [Aggregatilineales bacterium]
MFFHKDVQHQRLRLTFRYVVITITAVIIIALITQEIPHEIPSLRYALFLGAVVLSAWIGGLGAGFIVTLISGLIVLILFPSSESPLVQQLGDDIAHVLIFSIVAITMSWVIYSSRRELQRMERIYADLQTIIDHAPDAIIARDRSGKIVYFNKAAAALKTDIPILDKEPEQIDHERNTSNIQLLDERGQTFSIDPPINGTAFIHGQAVPSQFKIYNRSNQTERWVHLVTTVIVDEQKKSQLSLNIFRDITETAVQQERLRQILDNLPAMVGMMTHDGVVIEANQMALDLGRLKRQNIIGKHFEQTYWWSYNEHAQERLRAAILKASQGEVIRYEDQIRTADNEFRTVDFMISPIRDHAGKIIALLPAAIDITKRVKVERERQALADIIKFERSRLESILANIPGIVWEGVGQPDGNQQITYVNPYAETMLGYPVSRWLTAPPIWPEIILPEDLPKSIEQAMELFEKSESGVIELRMVAADGRIVPVEAYISTIDPIPGGAKHMVGIIMDMSARKRAETLLNRYAQRLQRSNQELQQFAYVASHDLQEPLRMISSYLQLIEARYSQHLDTDGRDFIHYAVDGANRMKELIQDLLAYSRVETRYDNYELVDMQAVVNEVQNRLSISITEAHASLQVKSLPTLSADYSQMVQLFQNLLSNAMKFRGANAPKIIIAAEKTGCSWRFSVQDNGIGIEEKYQDRVFVIFQRLHGIGAYPGTGIGLAICKRVVDRHGGDIWFESRPGHGTTFYFTLPDRCEDMKDIELHEHA